MSDAADREVTEADRAPWTVKSMRKITTKKAMVYANKAGETMAEWLDRAIHAEADRQDGTRILPPNERSASPADGPGAVAVYTPRAPVDVAALAELMQAALATAQASGVAPSKTMARHAQALVTAQLRQARGLPPRQTKRENGQTIEGETS
jgi:hypothetical protein